MSTITGVRLFYQPFTSVAAGFGSDGEGAVQAEITLAMAAASTQATYDAIIASFTWTPTAGAAAAITRASAAAAWSTTGFNGSTTGGLSGAFGTQDTQNKSNLISAAGAVAAARTVRVFVSITMSALTGDTIAAGAQPSAAQITNFANFLRNGTIQVGGTFLAAGGEAAGAIGIGAAGNTVTNLTANIQNINALPNAVLTILGLLPTPCFRFGTRLLTPEGYKEVETLKDGDLITTSKNEIVPVQSMVSFVGDKLYCLPKDSLKKNKPMNDLFMSADHAFKNNGKWNHMKCASTNANKCTVLTDEKKVDYFHVILDNYFAHTLVAEGVEVESCFKYKDNGEYVVWSCDEKCCTPLKCTEESEKKSKKPSFSMKVSKDEKKTLSVTKYSEKLNRTMHLRGSEIALPH